MVDKSETRANEIIQIHLKNLEKSLQEEILSVILVGSLTNNSYAGNVGSDIDLIHVLKDEAPAVAREEVIKAISESEAQTKNDLPISKCVYRFSQLQRPYPTEFELNLENKDLIELPIEILRVLGTGITIWGENIIDFIDEPTRQDIINSRELTALWNKQEREKFPERFREYEKNVENPPTRILIQSVIVNGMLDYYFITGQSCSSKKEIGQAMKENVGNYHFQELLDLCIVYRYTPEQVTQSEEQWMQKQYSNWRQNRKDQVVGAIEHLLIVN